MFRLKYKLIPDSLFDFNSIEKLIKTIEKLKLELTNRKYKYSIEDRQKTLILNIRMEHLQIKKHQKIAMKCLQELEDLIFIFNNK